MTFKKLFEKLEMNDKGGVAAIAEYYLNEMNKNIFSHQISYQFLYGFLYGLYGSGFISALEHNDLYNQLLNMKFLNK